MSLLTEKRLYWLLIAAASCYLFQLMSPILVPFLFSALLAYLGDPIVDRLEKRFSRTTSVVIVFATIIIVLTVTVLIFIPLVSDQLSRFIGKLPAAVNFVQDTVVPFLANQFEYNAGTGHDAIKEALKNNLADVPTLAKRLLAWVTGSSAMLIAAVANLFLIPVVTFYLLRDWDILVAKVRALIPRPVEPRIAQLCRESDDMLSAFLRGQFAVMNALAIIYSIGLSIVGIDSAIVIGFLAGWLSFVPYLGLIVGLGGATVVAYFQFGDIVHPLGVVATFVIGQALEGSVLTPRLVGERIGLHPVAVIFAVIAGAQLAGFAGMLLALPVAAVLNVLVSHAQVAYQSSTLYNEPSRENHNENTSNEI